MIFRCVALAAVLAVSSLVYAQNAKVVGWRGDGTGRYPDANPPTVWYKKENGDKKNILWETKLPCYSWATPVIVGDKLFTRSEPYDLICLNKNTGKILWIRSYPSFIAVPAEEKTANPAWKDVEPLVAELQKVNDEFAAEGWTKELYKRKYDLQKKINQLTAKADKKYELPPDKYVESWSGYTGSTPCSDGQHIYFSSGNGVTACYDLNGNNKWAKFEAPMLVSYEHGLPWSAGLFGDKLLVPLVVPPGDRHEVQARNKATGEPVWRTFFPKARENYFIVPFNVGGVEYGAIFDNLFRVSDGKSVPIPGTGGDGVAEGDLLFAVHIYGHVTWCRIGSDLKVQLVTPGNKEGYQQLSIPPADEAKKYESGSNAYTASPLYYNGLLYVLSNWGRLAVIDPAKAELAYVKMLPFDFKNPPGRKTLGMGIGASPALAGKYIYMIDSAGCTIVMEPGREYKQVAKNNIDYTVPDGWEPNHWLGPHHEQTEASPIADGSRLYIRGEQFMYCIGEQ